ncbi:addiction module protein [uncultured Thiodictyon sp.]|jgi:putative addiction module component (TIGR02574 family)|uniref:addiction module protein n=1 Tax=uncultured Thiodictyon sp. TaxID=1846217 RepID=UPI0025FA38B9|nr:addiction module protein [uncultured Thiodictyon sp.]
MVDAALISQVRKLDVADRIELIRTVWETFDEPDLAITEAEKALLDARLADAEENPTDQSPWPEVQSRLLRQLP